jgi:hypothetical protein
LQQGVGRPAVDDLSATGQLLAARDTAQSAADSATPRHSNFRQGFNTGSKSDDGDRRLRRACRIALVELEEAASAIEICSRILRRESFSFINHESAVIAVVLTLEAMANDGETRCLEADSCRRWERIEKEGTL